MRALSKSRRVIAAVAVGVLVVGAGWFVWQEGDGGGDGPSGAGAADAEPPDGDPGQDVRWAECRQTARDVGVSSSSAPGPGEDGAPEEPGIPDVDVPLPARDDRALQSDDPSAPGPGAPGIGDPYFPELGNGGYDVLHYLLDLAWDPDREHLQATTTVDAVAVRPLSRFNLDLVGLEVATVEVDGQTAAFDRTGERELEIAPEAPLAEGDDFQVVVAYEGTPEPIEGLIEGLGGWQSIDGEVFVAAEPDGAASFYPVNDHPADKACYSFRLTAPDDLVAVANGVQVTSGQRGGAEGTLTWEYEALEPMASYLVQVAIANFVIEESESDSGVPLRHVIDEDVHEQGADGLAPTAEVMDFFVDLFGPYPFATYGGLVVDDFLGFALETQTLSLFGPNVLREEIIVHELAHQWYGNSVSPATWQDVWLNEGFATYAEWLWSEHADAASVDTIAVARARSAGSGLDSPPGDPGSGDLFNRTVYIRGALTLHALRHEVGDEVFFEILREWADRYGGSSASSEDFETLAAEIADRNLADLFDVWLRSDELPDLQDWLG